MDNRGFTSFIIIFGIILTIIALAILGAFLLKNNSKQVQETKVIESPLPIQSPLIIPSPSPSTNIFKSELFSFEYPNGWRVESDGSLITVLKEEDDSQTPGCFINVYVSENTEQVDLAYYTETQPITFANVSGKYREQRNDSLPTVGGCTYPIEVYIPHETQTITVTYDKSMKEELFNLLNTLRFNE
jgi:hypothetical protein